MGLSKIIAISGKPGLFAIVSQSAKGIIVESLIDNKKISITNTQNVSVLNDIAMYTYSEEVPLREIFLNIFKKEEGKETINHKESNKVLLEFLETVLPEFDKDRVYASNVKKLVSWYNMLVSYKFDFETLKEVEQEETESTSEDK
ncbi:MAG: DUF5606 domain-containing protein [Flavobacteriaceae bacterium]|nr:DUF5606 domain-containing protein [Flavobacteriaceae bacterium]